MTPLVQLFQKHFQIAAESIEPLQGNLGGSGRTIYRLRGGTRTAIGVHSPDKKETVAFLNFSRHFRALSLPVPEIFADDPPSDIYLQQDLGDTTLYQFLVANRDGANLAPAAIAAYRRAVELLPRFQIQGARDLDTTVCYPRADFDQQSIAWDLNYFKYYFLRLSGVAFDEQALQNDFDRLTTLLLEAPAQYFLYRDFQSRNIMLVDGQAYGIDYQGGRLGALQYDIASLLFDAKADLPPAFRQQMLDHYLASLANHAHVERNEFLRHYYPFAIIRILQALGAYGFRGYYERKPHFLASVPYALANLAWILQNIQLPIELPSLFAALRYTIAAQPAISSSARISSAGPSLTVRVNSFSFHRGLPQDPGNNGGGFIFDARSLPNPGREEQYKSLTGQHPPVAAYLEKLPASQQFFANAFALVESSIHAYQGRGFTDLMVSFGCTGGQHRSVFFAEKMARHLRAVPGVNVELRHHELARMAAEK